MNKKYILHYLKELIPLYSVFLVLLVVTLIGIVAFNDGFSYSTRLQGPAIQTSPILPMYIVAIVFTFITPFFGYSYRYKSKKADLYNQLPFKDNGLKVTHLFIHVALTAICFILVASITMVLMYWNQAANNPYSYGRSITFYYNYGWFFLSILIFAFFIAVEQIINHFVASKANNYGDCFLYLIMFFVLRLFILYDLVSFFPREVGLYTVDRQLLNDFDIEEVMIYLNITPLSAEYLVYYLTSPALCNYSAGYLLASEDTSIIVYIFVSLFLYIALAAYTLIDQILFKEKYQENLGRKRNGKSWFDYLLPHVFFLVISLAIFMPSRWAEMSVLTVMGIISLLVGYYGLLAILNRDGKLNKKDLIAAGINVGLLCLIVFNYAYGVTVYDKKLKVM